jgi:hypothetical protein
MGLDSGSAQAGPSESRSRIAALERVVAQPAQVVWTAEIARGEQDSHAEPSEVLDSRVPARSLGLPESLAATSVACEKLDMAEEG